MILTEQTGSDDTRLNTYLLSATVRLRINHRNISHREERKCHVKFYYTDLYFYKLLYSECVFLDVHLLSCLFVLFLKFNVF